MCGPKILTKSSRPEAQSAETMDPGKVARPGLSPKGLISIHQCIMGLIIMTANAVDFRDPHGESPISAWGFIVGFSGLLGADVYQWWTAPDDGVVLLNIQLNAVALLLMVVGGIGHIPEIETASAPWNGLGMDCWLAGSMCLTVSQFWKAYRAIKTQTCLDEFAAFLVEISAGTGAWLFYVGCVMYDSRMIDDFAIQINHVWLIGCLLFTAGPLYLIMTHFTWPYFIAFLGGMLFILGTIVEYFTTWRWEPLLGASIYLVGCLGFTYVDGLEFCMIPSPSLAVWLNGAMSVIGDLMYTVGCIGFLPIVKHEWGNENSLGWGGQFFSRLGIECFIQGSIVIGVAQYWKAWRLQSEMTTDRLEYTSVMGELIAAFGAALIFSGAQFYDANMVPIWWHHIFFMLGCMMLTAAPMYLAFSEVVMGDRIVVSMH